MKKFLKISGISFGVVILLLLLMLVSPFLFKDKLAAAVKSTANKKLKTELNFSGIDVSFFHYFPGEILNGGGIDGWGVLVFSLTIIVFVTLGAIIFQKRDIAIS